MPHLDHELRRASRQRLLELSRDALRLTDGMLGHRPCTVHNAPSAAEVSQTLGLLTQTVQALEVNLSAVQGYVADNARTATVEAVEGPFEGEPHQASTTTVYWLEHARAQSTALRQAIENAHIASAGLASRGPAHGGRR